MPFLAQILQRPDVWRGDALAAAPLPGLASGFAELDAELPGHGWPRNGLAEILVEQNGLGELTLLLPMLARLSAEELAWVIFVAPPHLLHAPALEAGGVALSRLLIVGSPGRDAAWACERALETEGVGTVVAWLPEIRPVQLRRLQMAAEQRHTLLCAFRPSTAAQQASPAPLRLALAGDHDHLRVRILKRRGQPLERPVSLAIPRPCPAPRRNPPDHALACPALSPLAARSARQTA